MSDNLQWQYPGTGNNNSQDNLNRTDKNYDKLFIVKCKCTM